MRYDPEPLPLQLDKILHEFLFRELMRISAAFGEDQLKDITVSDFIKTLLDDPDMATAAATLGVVPLAGGSMTGDLRRSGPAGTNRAIYFDTDGTPRWALITNSTAEGGADAGSNLVLQNYDDAGALLGNVLAFSRATGLVGLDKGQLRFPATQNPSADLNTMDDYAENTWTPALTFTTPGNLNVVYGSRSGIFTKLGNIVIAEWALITTTWTHTTASGTLTLTGLPFTAAANANANAQATGMLSQSGINLANYYFTPRLVNNTDTIQFIGTSIAGGARAAASIIHAPSGAQQSQFGVVIYRAAS